MVFLDRPSREPVPPWQVAQSEPAKADRVFAVRQIIRNEDHIRLLPVIPGRKEAKDSSETRASRCGVFVTSDGSVWEGMKYAGSMGRGG